MDAALIALARLVVGLSGHKSLHCTPQSLRMVCFSSLISLHGLLSLVNAMPNLLSCLCPRSPAFNFPLFLCLASLSLRVLDPEELAAFPTQPPAFVSPH